MARFSPLLMTDLPDGAWSTTLAIRFSHCDPAGIVYTPHYFDLFNGVIEDWYGQALGFPYHGLIGERRLGLGYAHASADFAAPSRMGDVIEAAVLLGDVGRSSIAIAVHAFREGRECVRGSFVTVTTSLATGSVLPVPEDLRAAFLKYREGCRSGDGHRSR